MATAGKQGGLLCPIKKQLIGLCSCSGCCANQYIDLVMIFVVYTFVRNLLTHSCQFIANHPKEAQNFMTNHGTDICATPAAYAVHCYGFIVLELLAAPD